MGPAKAHLHPTLAPVGSIEDGTDEEVAEAEVWLRAQGCTVARGPMGPNTWLPYRANLGPYKRPPFIGETTFGPEVWEARGYRVAARYVSSLADNLAQAESSMARACELVSAGWTLKTLNELGGFEAALPRFYELTIASFRRAYAYTSIEWGAFKQLYAPVAPLIDPELVVVACSPEGEMAGYCFAIPDRPNPQLKQFVVKTLAVDPKWRTLGLGSWLVGNVHSRAHTAGWTGGGIHALMWTGSHSRQISAHAGEIIREYALFEKDLA
jgi:L-amino acid N-acyltransferase YncA